MEADYQTARTHYLESLRLAREAGDRYALSLALSSLGITAFQQGNFTEADGYYQESMLILNQLNDRVGLSLLYCYLGLLALAQGQAGAARKSFEEGVSIAWQSDIKLYLGYNLIGIACVLLSEDCPASTAKLLSAVTAYTQKIGFKLETELQQPYDQALAATKERLDEASFQATWGEGQTMSVEQAVQFALDSKDE
jgi:tetratricopeptide (TPR) repeat protein